MKVDPLPRLLSHTRRHRSGCLLWTGGVARANGYGRAWLDGNTIGAHVAFYILLRGPVPEGMQIDHLCHNQDLVCPGGTDCTHRRCVNIEHLEVVTPTANQRRQGLRKTHCPQGHEYNEKNTYMNAGRRPGWVSRTCRICHAACERNRRAVSSAYL